MPITEGIVVPITADASGLESGMDAAKTAVSSFGTTMTESVGGFSKSLYDLQSKLLDLRAALILTTEPEHITFLGSEIQKVTIQIQDQEAAYRKLGATIGTVGVSAEFTQMSGLIEAATNRLTILKNSLSTATDTTDIKNINKLISEQQIELKGLQSIGVTSTKAVSAEFTRMPGLLEAANNRLVILKNGLKAATDPKDIIVINGLIQEQQRELQILGNQGIIAGEKSAIGFGSAISSARRLQFILRTFGGIGLFAIFSAVYEAIGLINKAANEAEKEEQKWKKSLDESGGSAQKNGFELQALVEIGRDHTKSLEERNEALRGANKLYTDQNEKLTLANINTEAVKKQVEGYTQALIANAIAAKYGDKLAEAYQKQRTAAREYGDALQLVTKLQGDFSKFGLDNSATLAEGGTDIAVIKYNDAFKKGIDATKKYKDATKELSIISGDYVNVLTEAVKLNAEFDKTADKKGPKDRIDRKPPKRERGVFDLSNLPLDPKVRALDQDLAGLNRTIAQTDPIITKTMIDAARVTQLETNQALELKYALQSLGSVVIPQLDKAFTTMFDNLLQSGKLSIASLFSDIGSLISRLLAAAAAAAILGTILNATGLGTILGVTGASEGFSGLFKSILGSSTGIHLASGGITTGPTRALIGEGKEREVVTPLSQLKNIIGSSGNNQPLPIPHLFMKGPDFWIAYQRAQLQSQRNT